GEHARHPFENARHGNRQDRFGGEDGGIAEGGSLSRPLPVDEGDPVAVALEPEGRADTDDAGADYGDLAGSEGLHHESASRSPSGSGSSGCRKALRETQARGRQAALARPENVPLQEVPGQAQALRHLFRATTTPPDQKARQ